jgi:hypothetical protein
LLANLQGSVERAARVDDYLDSSRARKPKDLVCACVRSVFVCVRASIVRLRVCVRLRERACARE